MRSYKLIVVLLRAGYIALTLLLSFLVLRQINFDIKSVSFSDFIIVESLIIYSLALSIKPTLKSIGIGIALSSLILPTLYPSEFIIIVSHQVSFFFYILFVSIAIISMLVFIFLGNGIKSQIVAGIVYFLVIAILFQYSLLGLDSLDQLALSLPSIYSNYLLSNFLLYSLILGAIGFILTASKKTEFRVFTGIRNVSIPYILVSFLPISFYLISSQPQSLPFFMLYAFPGYPIVIMSVVATALGIILNGRRDFLASLIVSLASLGISILFLNINKYYSFEFLMSGASVIPAKLADPIEIENKLFEAVKEGRYTKANEYLRILNRLGYSTSRIYCNALAKRACDVIIWLPSKGRIDYYICPNLRYAVDCIISKGTLPNDVISLLKAVSQRHPDAAERLAGYILTKSQEEYVRQQAREVLAKIIGISQPQQSTSTNISLPRLEDWYPEIWLNTQIYGYKISKVLGKGGTSYVLLGERGNERYAIKIPKLTPSKDGKESYTAFADVSKESSKLQEISEKSPNIVKLYGIFIDVNNIKSIVADKNVQLYYSNPPAIIMEYMAGGTAEDLLKNNALFLSESWKKIVALISLQVAKAVKTIHDEGYVHLDIKPSNIFFSSFPGKYAGEVLTNLRSNQVIVKLGDLGSARRVGEKFMEYTPQYCSIDQVKAMLLGKGAEKSMDIYALGATIYKLLTREQFNTPSLVNYMDKAVELYLSKNGNFNIYLSSAENEYVKYYQSLNANDEFMRLIKSMTNPDPLKRPSIDVVITELNNILNKL